MAHSTSVTDIIGLLSISLALLISSDPGLNKNKEEETRNNTKRRNMEFVDLLEGHSQQQR